MRRSGSARLRPAGRVTTVAFTLAFAGLLAAGLGTTSIAASEGEGASKAAKAQSKRHVVVPMVDADRGRRLFVTKGCIICHTVNGVGGSGGPALDSAETSQTVDVLGFAARMWRGASAMLKFQELELGYQINLDGGEIADLAGFLSNRELQDQFSMEEVPEPMRDWMLFEPYWLEEDWPEDLPETYEEYDESEET